jgi:hypothetical protein
MPFRSKAQQRFMFAAESRGELPKGTAKRWAHHTDDIKHLPEKVKKKKGRKKMKKTAGIRPKSQVPKMSTVYERRVKSWAKQHTRKRLERVPIDKLERVQEPAMSVAEALKKVSFVVGFSKTARPMQSLAGTMEAALKKHNKGILDKMKAAKPLYPIEHIRTLYPGAFKKTAEPILAMDALQLSGVPMQDAVPGTSIRSDAETGQFKGKNYRTRGVQNEDKEFNPKLKQKAQTARGGKHYGGQVYEGFSKEDKR